MTELEKIEYAKTYIDCLADGINPLDGSPIPDGDLACNVRVSRCFFYVSSILQREIERERKKAEKENKPKRLPFSISPERLLQFEYSEKPIPVTEIARRLSRLAAEDGEGAKVARFPYRKILYFLRAVGMIEWRIWENGKYKRFPTAEGEAMGLVSMIWQNYGRKTPVIYFTEAAQRFILDNLDAVMAAEKGSSYDERED